MQEFEGTPILTRDELAEQPPQPAFANPPGHARDEEMRKRQDELEAKIDRLMAALDVEAIDGAAMQEIMEDREIAGHLADGHLFVTNADPAYMYKWVDFFHASGTMAWQAKAAGWIQVSGDDKECYEHRKEDGSRRVGDVMLFKMRKDLHFLMEQREEKKRIAREYGVESTLEDLADRNPGIRFFSTTSGDLPESAKRRMEGNARTQAARRVAMKSVDGMLRKGTVPGMPSPGGGDR